MHRDSTYSHELYIYANNSVWGKCTPDKIYNVNIQWYASRKQSDIIKCEVSEIKEQGGEWLIYELITLDVLEKRFKLNRRKQQTKVGSFIGQAALNRNGKVKFIGTFKSVLIG